MESNSINLSLEDEFQLEYSSRLIDGIKDINQLREITKQCLKSYKFMEAFSKQLIKEKISDDFQDITIIF